MQFPIIQEHSQLKQAVSARELFNFLAINDRFSVWIDRMIGYGFSENQDYLGCSFYDTRANKNLVDYVVSVDMAKEISMIQRSEKGKQARQYFIECERLAKQAAQPIEPVFQIPQTLGEALQLAANQALQIEHDAPKVAFFDTVANRENLMNISQVAKKIGLTPQKLNTRLDTIGVYDKRNKRGGRVFNQWVIEQGYGKMKVGSTGYDQGLITQLGQQWIVGLFGSEAQL